MGLLSLGVSNQHMIEAGRHEYTIRRGDASTSSGGYTTALGSCWQGIGLRGVGHPKMDLTALKMATAASARKALETGIASGVTWRKR